MADVGLRSGGGIGDATLPITYDNNELYFVKFAFDCTFHIMVIIVMVNILFGIIIDTFAQLRDLKQSIDLDMRNICFICNIDRNTVRTIFIFDLYYSLINILTVLRGTLLVIITSGNTSSTLCIYRARILPTTQVLSPMCLICTKMERSHGYL